MKDRNYRVKISFGDGCPIEDIIKAKSGYDARNHALVKHPRARNVYILGVEEGSNSPGFCRASKSTIGCRLKQYG